MTGEATKVDIGMFDCQLALLENAAIRYFTSGKAPGPLGARHPSITPFEAFETGDGYVIVAAGNDALFRKLADALGRPEWRSEEHTSELQSLMRISYAVFCLKKKNPANVQSDIHHQT